MDFKINPCLKNFTLDKNNVCDLCQKRILKEKELADIDLNCTTEEICVITTNNRVNTNYILHPFRIFGISILLVFGGTLFSLNAHAQDTIKQIQDSLVVQQSSNQHEYTIKGTVVDENGEVVPFANVYIPNEDQTSIITGQTTDLDGKFILKYIPNAIGNDSVIININSVLYKNKRLAISKQSLLPAHDLGVITMDDSEIQLMGMMIPYEQRIIDPDPNAHRSTKIGRDELKRSPYRD